MNITNTTGIITNTIDDYVNTAIYLANNNYDDNNDNNNSNDGDNNDNDVVTNEYKSFFKKLKASQY